MATLTLQSANGAINLVPEDGSGTQTVVVPRSGIIQPQNFLQVQTSTVNTIASYASSVNSETIITPMNISITPQETDSKIIVQWMLNGEQHQDNVFRIWRNGAEAPNGRNTINTSRWTGFVSGFYDQNESSTPSNWFIQYIDDNPPSGLTTYSLTTGSSSGSNFTFFLNRTYGSSDAGQDAYERMVSTVMAMEVR